MWYIHYTTLCQVCQYQNVFVSKFHQKIFEIGEKERRRAEFIPRGGSLLPVILREGFARSPAEGSRLRETAERSGTSKSSAVCYRSGTTRNPPSKPVILSGARLLSRAQSKYPPGYAAGDLNIHVVRVSTLLPETTRGSLDSIELASRDS